MSRRVQDPVQAARDWVAKNFQAEGAEHVLSALASAERYRRLAQEAAEAPPGGTRVVVCTVGDTFRAVTLTSPSQRTDEEIAKFLGDYIRLVQGIAAELAVAEVGKYLAASGFAPPSGEEEKGLAAWVAKALNDTVAAERDRIAAMYAAANLPQPCRCGKGIGLYGSRSCTTGGCLGDAPAPDDAPTSTP